MSKITKRSDDFSRWYNDIITHAELAENSGVGLYGYKTLWFRHMGTNEVSFR